MKSVLLRRGQVALEIPGKEDPILLRFGIRAIRAIESEVGENVPFLEYVKGIGADGTKIGDRLVDMFLYAALEEQPEMTIEVAEVLISDAGLAETMHALTQCVTVAFPAPKETQPTPGDLQEGSSDPAKEEGMEPGGA